MAPRKCSPPADFNPKPLRDARRVKGWTLAELARMIGRSQPTCSDILAGKRAAIWTVRKMADALGVDPADCWREAPTQEDIA